MVEQAKFEIPAEIIEITAQKAHDTYMTVAKSTTRWDKQNDINRQYWRAIAKSAIDAAMEAFTKKRDEPLAQEPEHFNPRVAKAAGDRWY